VAIAVRFWLFAAASITSDAEPSAVNWAWPDETSCWPLAPDALISTSRHRSSKKPISLARKTSSWPALAE
jgi:hypothetical protein